MALYKKDVLVRPNSSADFDAAMNWTLDWLTNNFQEAPGNKNEDGTYKDYFFADVFFANGHPTNGGQLWRIYTNPCADKYGLQPASTGRIEFLMIDSGSINRTLEDYGERIDALENRDAEVEKMIKSFSSKVDELISAKEKDILTV